MVPFRSRDHDPNKSYNISMEISLENYQNNLKQSSLIAICF